MIKVILTAIGCPGGPSIIQALREDPNIYLIGTDIRDQMVGKYLVDEFHQVPPGRSDEFVPAMFELAKKTEADVILPLATFELLNLSKNIEVFEEINCKVCVSEYDSLLIANDRHLLYSKFDEDGLSPEFRILKNGRELRKLSQELGFPEEKVVIKPFISHGSIALRIIDKDLDLFNQFRFHKPNNMKIPMDFAEMIFADRDYDDMILTEFLPGKEFGIDMLVNPKTNEIISMVARDNGTVFHSEISNGFLIEDEELYSIGRLVTSKLKLAYTINIDVKVDKNGKSKLLEINPRMPATSFLAHSAGLNLPLNSIYLALDMPLKLNEINDDRRIFSYRGFVVVDHKGDIQEKAL